MNIYTPDEIEEVLAASLEACEETAGQFIDAVGRAVAHKVDAMHGTRPVAVVAGNTICGAYAISTAIHLHRLGCMAQLYLLNIGGNRLEDATARQRDRFLEEVGQEYLFETTGMRMQMAELDKSWVVVDGLFGREHTGALTGGYQALARYINESGATVVAIDLPSGMSPDLTVGMINRNIIHAHTTLTLVGATAALFMRENAELTGQWEILDLPYDQAAIKAIRCRSRLIEAHNVRKILPVRDPYANKNDLGHLQIFAGAYGMMGAAVLATRAALRSGCGKVTCTSPSSGYYIMQTAVPAALFQGDEADAYLATMEIKRHTDAIAAGPGIGTADETIDALDTLLKQCNASRRPLILDADALNCMALRPTMIDNIPAMSVLTPHEREFDKLFGTQHSSSARLLKAIETAASRSIVIVLKGHYTVTVWPDGSTLFNSSGTAALATAGSGDVLTGIIGALMARGLSPELAAVAGVYIHGIAGQISAGIHGIDGTTAEDIAQNVGAAIKQIRQQ